MVLLREITSNSLPETVVMLGALCPACDVEHNFRVNQVFWDSASSTDKDAWEFNGDYEKPTFSPSMLANKDNWYPDLPLCHSFVKNGQWEFLADSTHDLAGQTVQMIPITTEIKMKQNRED